MKKTLLVFLAACTGLYGFAQSETPTQAQLAWHNQEFYLFAHFGPNTFTGEEWGHGTEKEEIFNPSELDCKQWVKTAKAAGATMIIITAKHHDGFCLWPSKFSTHTVRESKWRDGKGDVLKELSAACKQGGLKFGIYISPWDRNHPTYGTPEYNQVFVNMMTEIFANYGPIAELWWDGANGEGPNGKKQVYDWPLFKKTVRKLSPNTVVFSDVGPDIRWAGNESGIAGVTNWNTLDIEGREPGAKAPPNDTLNTGNKFGKYWIPSECDVSIRPGWFYHKEEDEKVKTPATLFNLYLKSVGRGANLLLNVPPDGRGKFHENDSIALIGFRRLLNDNFSKNLAAGLPVVNIDADGIAGKPYRLYTSGDVLSWASLPVNHSLQISFKKPIAANCITISELISEGQNIASGKIVLLKGNKTIDEIPFTTIGRKRIITFRTTEFDGLRVAIAASKADALISSISVFKIDDDLVEK
jgi:alpha-L-fucosidase